MIHDIRFSAQNQKLYELEDKLSKIKYDIFVLSEVTRRREMLFRTRISKSPILQRKGDSTYGGI